MGKYIWINGRKYYYYGTYRSWDEAYRLARYYRKKNKKCRYYIQKIEQGILVPYNSYRLYLTHVITLGSIF